jgi:hypothetical protein
MLFLAKGALTYFLLHRIDIVNYSIFTVKHSKERKKEDFLFINFRLAVNMF